MNSTASSNTIAAKRSSLSRFALPALGIMALVLMLMEPAFAQAGGVESRATAFMDNVIGVLKAVSIGAVTIAVMICGYGIAFGGKTFRDVAPILIGGVIIGAASYIASMILG